MGSRLCHADISAIAQTSAQQLPMSTDTTNGRTWVFSSLKSTAAYARTGTPIAITSGRKAVLLLAGDAELSHFRLQGRALHA